MGRAATASALIAPPPNPAAGPVLCDQAIFTSVHSGTGEGYRIIAASPGIQPAEKVEITRRSPSHGGLCDETSDTVGLEAYLLPTRRHAIAWCCHAGQEHTARGGQRVYTHVVVMDRAAYRRFGGNAAAVHAVLGTQMAATGPILKPPARLEKIALVPAEPAGTMPSSGWLVRGTDPIDWVLAATGDLLARRPVVLLDAAARPSMLEKVLLSLPMATRETLSLSSGVRYSPSRRMDLAITWEPAGDLERRMAGQKARLGRLSQPAPATDPGLEAWLGLLRRWWRESRRRDILRLTTELCKDAPAETLPRLAAICEQIDALSTMPAPEAQELMRRYEPMARAAGSSPAMQSLAQHLLETASHRLALNQP